MIRPRTFARAAIAALALASPLALTSGAASASTSTIVLSAASGRPYARPTVSAPTCVDDPSHQTTLRARLITGAGSKELLAGQAVGWAGDPAILVVPDWANPAAPAYVEARCEVLDLTTWNVSTLNYPAVPFDILPPVTLPQQATTLSRTTLQAGQGLTVNGTGCNQPDTVGASTNITYGSDRSGRSLVDPSTFASTQAVTAGQFATEPIFSASGVETELVDPAPNLPFDPQRLQIGDMHEEAVEFTAGKYTAFTACEHQDGSALYFRPDVITLSANGATANSDLDAPGPGHEARLAGQTCSQSSVRILLDAISLHDLRAQVPVARGAGSRASGNVDGQNRITRSSRDLLRSSKSARSSGTLLTTGSVDTTVATAPDGSWSYTDLTAFDEGLVHGIGICGDPYGAGFAYALQGLHVSHDPQALPDPNG